MRLIDTDALEKFLADAEMEATMRRKYVLAGALNTIQGNLRNFPTTEPDPHWISCKERLPENYVDVLVWFEYYRYGSYNRLYQTYGIGTYSENYDSWTINHESGWHKLRVIAWQPLPEPFKKEGGEE